MAQIQRENDEFARHGDCRDGDIVEPGMPAFGPRAIAEHTLAGSCRMSLRTCSTAHRCIVAEPDHKTLLVRAASGERQHCSHDRLIACGDLPIVFGQKQRRGEKSNALVTVDKGVISHDAEGVGSRQVENGRLGVSRAVHRASERCIEQSRVADPRPPAMLGELFVMDRQHDVSCKPTPSGHRASSRKAFLCFFISFRAEAIWRANSGSYGVIRNPSGVSVKNTVSPCSTRSFDRASFGRSRPAELPTLVILSAITIIPCVITDVRPYRLSIRNGSR